MRSPLSLLDLFAVLLAVWLAVAVGSFLATWLAESHTLRRAVRNLERALQREVSTGAASELTAKATISRLRHQRNELLEACAGARSALLEVQLEARAREAQIRRMASDSEFGRL